MSPSLDGIGAVNSGMPNPPATTPSKGTYPMNEGLAAADRRIQVWTSRRQRSQELKNLFEGRWVSNWNAYRNVVEPLTDPADWWRSNESVPTVFKIVETVLPRLVQGMFASPDWFYVEARNARSEMYEVMCYNLLRQVIEDMELFPKLYQAMRYSTVMGHCWGKVTWKETYQKRQVMRQKTLTNREWLQRDYGEEAVNEAELTFGVAALDEPSAVSDMVVEVVEEEDFNGPDFEWRPLDRIFPDPTGRGRWYMEEIHTTVDELNETQNQLNIYDQSMLNAVEREITINRLQGVYGGLDSIGDARSGTTAGVSIEYAREPETTEGVPEWIVTPMREGGGVSLWQCWGWVPPELRGDDDVEWRLTVIAEGRFVLRDVPAPTPDGKPPYFPIKSIDIPTILYGDSIVSYTAPLAEQQTRLSNMRLDEVFLSVWQQYLFRKNAVVSDNAMLFQPGGAIEVNPAPGQTISDTFMALPRREVLGSVWQEDSWRQQQAEHVAGATDVMQGVGMTGASTATESSILANMGGARHGLQIMYNDYTVKKELLTRIWMWLQKRLLQPKLVRMQGEEYAQVDLNDIQIPIDIGDGGGMSELSRQSRVQMDQELIQLMTSPLTTQYFRPIPVLRRWMMDRGWKNPDAYIMTEEEFYAGEEQRGFDAGMAEMGQMEYAAGMAANGAPGRAPQAGPKGTPGAPRMPNVSSAADAASMAGRSSA